MSSIKKGWQTFLRVLPSLLLFEIIYKILSICIFVPVGKELVSMMLDISGENILYNYGMAKLLLSLPGIAAIILVLVCSIILIYFEYSVMILTISNAHQNKDYHFKAIFKEVLVSFHVLGNWSSLLFFVYIALLSPLIHIGIVNSIIPSVNIPYFVTGELLRRSYGNILLNIGYGALYLFYFSLIFILPTMILKEMNFLKALKYNYQIIRRTKIFNFLPLLGIILLWVLIFNSGIIPVDFSTLFEENLLRTICTIFFSVDRLLQALTGVVVWGLQTILVIMFLTFVCTVFLQTETEITKNENVSAFVDVALDKTQQKLHDTLNRIYNYFLPLFKKIHISRVYVAVLCPCLLVGGLYFMYQYAQEPPALFKPIVVGHRCSDLGVENTMSAFNGAIESEADYAEIDIQLTKDGIPVIHHDGNLQRLAGVNKSVNDYTLEELKKVELKQGDKTDHIATLQEMMDAGRGKIKLLIELKASGGEKEQLVDTVIQTIRDNHYENDCIIMSLDYELVSMVKEKYSSLTVGYCLFGNIGDLSTESLLDLNVDFLVIEEGVVSQNFTAKCRQAWLPVLVWTVDDADRMEKYLDMGINGIITDKPYIAKEKIDEFNESEGISIEYMN